MEIGRNNKIIYAVLIGFVCFFLGIFVGSVSNCLKNILNQLNNNELSC